jgi:hypothetical protein
MESALITGKEILLALEIAIAGYVFSGILTQPGHLFDWYGRMLERLRVKWQKCADPLGYCPLCFTGQLSFWLFLYYNLHHYNIVRHILFTSMAIFLVAAVGKVYGILKKINARLRTRHEEKRDMA